MLEEIAEVVETVCIVGRTTAVVRAVTNCYAPTITQFCPTRPEPTVTGEGKGKGQKLLAQGIALGYYGRKTIAL